MAWQFIVGALISIVATYVLRPKPQSNPPPELEDVQAPIAEEAAKMCSRGARAFFRRHGLNWQTFVSKGLPADTIAATGDAMALDVIRVANERKRQKADSRV